MHTRHTEPTAKTAKTFVAVDGCCVYILLGAWSCIFFQYGNERNASPSPFAAFASAPVPVNGGGSSDVSAIRKRKNEA